MEGRRGGARASLGDRIWNPPAGASRSYSCWANQQRAWGAGRGYRGGGQQKPNQMAASWSDGFRGPWSSERGTQRACPPGPIAGSPQCGASASNARLAQLIVSSRELFAAAAESSGGRRSRAPRGEGEASPRAAAATAQGCESCHGAAQGPQAGAGGRSGGVWAASFPRSLAAARVPS